jgi:hypothetical protein
MNNHTKPTAQEAHDAAIADRLIAASNELNESDLTERERKAAFERHLQDAIMDVLGF